VSKHGAPGPCWYQASANMGLEHHALTLFTGAPRPPFLLVKLVAKLGDFLPKNIVIGPKKMKEIEKSAHALIREC
jgi:hypothetical protein